jgi:hypothetical protein
MSQSISPPHPLPEATAINLLDREELDGTLLAPASEETENSALPKAEPVLLAAEEPNQDAAVPTTLPPVLPSKSTSLHNPVRDKARADRGTRLGLVQTELEAEGVERENRNVYAVNYFQDEKVRQANEHARERQRKEDLGVTQTSYASAVEEEAEASAMAGGKAVAPSEEFFEGTYGKEYEVSSYDVSSYETSEYDVTRYTSVYEK